MYQLFYGFPNTVLVITVASFIIWIIFFFMGLAFEGGQYSEDWKIYESRKPKDFKFAQIIKKIVKFGWIAFCFELILLVLVLAIRLLTMPSG